MIGYLILCILSRQAFGSVDGPLTSDFQNWLQLNGYAADNFVRSDYGTKGSYGGRVNSSQNISNVPVIFIHGNSDTALQTNTMATGWDSSISYFLSKGYITAELYATSWGDNKPVNAGTRTHNCHEAQRLRRFVEAILSYTNQMKVSLVTHSMGVTLMRKVIKGGQITATDSSCNIGKSLATKVDVFVGLAGGNYGLCSCSGVVANIQPTCNKKNGYWPGDSCGANHYTCGVHPLSFPCTSLTYSSYLTDLNNDLSSEGTEVFSVWSNADDLIQNNDYVWGRPTSLIPTSTGKKIYPNLTHMQTKEKTAADQYTMVHDRKIPA